MEGFLKLKLPAWQRVMVTRSIALIPAVLVALANEVYHMRQLTCPQLFAVAGVQCW